MLVRRVHVTVIGALRHAARTLTVMVLVSAGAVACGADEPFEHMWNYRGDSDSAQNYGTLLIELPCVYLIPPDEFGADDAGQRIMLSLPKGITRYDPTTGALRVANNGPFFSGDQVEVGGGGGARTEPPCRAASTWTADSMGAFDPSKW